MNLKCPYCGEITQLYVEVGLITCQFCCSHAILFNHALWMVESPDMPLFIK